MNKEPFLQVSKRRNKAGWQERLLIRFIALILALIVCGAVIVALVKMNPVDVYKAIWDGAMGSERRIWQTIRDTMILLCIAIGLAPAFKMKFWNIGAEGQILIGGACSAAVMIYAGDKMSPILLLIVMFIASAIGGMIWGMIPAVFKAYWNTNETLFTLMLNYVAMQVVTYCIVFWENPKGSNTVGIINQATQAGWLPELFGQKYGWNVLIVLILTVGMFIYLKYCKQGYEIAVVGESENTARYAGIHVKKVIIRTLDIGADKQVDYFGLDKEDNPAMGYRAIRICLDRREVFKTQLRALYRASYYGTIAIMFPMIISVTEVQTIKKIIEEVKKELDEEKIPYKDVELGIMIETPAAVMMSEELAQEVDFFSVGTNDLTQYTLAIDRQNPKLDNIYDSHHPAILKMLKMIVDNGHKGGCWVGICGELGADTTLTETFLRMGFDELSVSPSMILKVRQEIRSLDLKA